MLYVAGCANGVSPCTGTNRQAMNPLTGQFLGPNSRAAIGTLVPNTGSLTNGVFAGRPGHRRRPTTSIRRSPSRRASARRGT